MATEPQLIALPGGLEVRGTAAGVRRFLWHFLQMAVAMEVGMMAYHRLLLPIVAGTPYAGLTNSYPLAGYWGMVVSMVLCSLIPSHILYAAGDPIMFLAMAAFALSPSSTQSRSKRASREGAFLSRRVGDGQRKRPGPAEKSRSAWKYNPESNVG